MLHPPELCHTQAGSLYVLGRTVPNRGFDVGVDDDPTLKAAAISRL
ncbi:MAG: hypothetical protein Ct9H300mP8_03130 [Gammaproteobacteria bacterium]|nr:MAG: hypothetical protein Ct9H300mP8_03130 [Gammaproteobacteria bacterium]